MFSAAVPRRALLLFIYAELNRYDLFLIDDCSGQEVIIKGNGFLFLEIPDAFYKNRNYRQGVR